MIPAPPCSEQLEYLEDKLREYRFLEPGDDEHKAVVLSQLDSVRRELIEVVRARAHHVLFGTEVVREVLAFASVSEDSGSGGGSADAGSPDQHRGGEEAVPPSGVLRSSYNRPPRYPSSGSKCEMTPPRGSRPASSDNLQRYEQEPAWAASSAGTTANHAERKGSASPGTASTVAVLSAATHSAADVATRQAELAGVQREADAAAGTRVHELARAARAAHPSGGVRSASPTQGGRAVSGGGRPSARLLTRLERPRLYSAGAPMVPGSAGCLRDEDIFGAVNGAGRPASIMNPSPRQYGGMVRLLGSVCVLVGGAICI